MTPTLTLGSPNAHLDHDINTVDQLVQCQRLYHRYMIDLMKERRGYCTILQIYRDMTLMFPSSLSNVQTSRTNGLVQVLS